MAREVRLRLSTTIPEKDIGNQSPPHTRFPPSLLPTSQPPVPRPRTQLVVPLSPPPPTPVGHSRGRSCPEPRRGGVSDPSHQRPKPAQLQDPGVGCGPRPLCGPDCGPPAEMRTPPPLSRSQPHNSGTQNPTGVRPPRCARQLARDPRGRRRAGARGGNRSEPAAQVRARRPGHSLDEVAGSLFREALLPAAGQVCGNAKKVGSNLSRPGAHPPERCPPPRRPGSHLSGSCGPSSLALRCAGAARSCSGARHCGKEAHLLAPRPLRGAPARPRTPPGPAPTPACPLARAALDEEDAAVPAHAVGPMLR